MPEGEWQGRIWFPSPAERRECCAAITPNPANPQALENHCRTLRHLSLLFDVPLEVLKRAVRKRRSGVVAGVVQESAQLAASLVAAAPPSRALDELVRVTGRARREARHNIASVLQEIVPLVSRLGDGETEGNEAEDVLREVLEALPGRTKAMQVAVDFWVTAENAYRNARSLK
jgi:hypothetical protein